MDGSVDLPARLLPALITHKRVPCPCAFLTRIKHTLLCLQMLRRNSPASTSGLPGAASRASSYWRGRYTLR